MMRVVPSHADLERKMEALCAERDELREESALRPRMSMRNGRASYFAGRMSQVCGVAAAATLPPPPTANVAFPNFIALTHKELDALLAPHQSGMETAKKEVKVGTLKGVVYQEDAVAAIRDLARHSLMHIMRCEDLDATVTHLWAMQQGGDGGYPKELPKGKAEKIQLAREMFGLV